MKTYPRKWLVRALATAAALVLVVAGCGDDGDTSAQGGNGDTATTSAATETQVNRSSEFRYAARIFLNGFDPHRSQTPFESAWQQAAYDTLLTIVEGPDGVEPAPRLAKSFEVAPDWSTISFELRDDVTFQDGTRFDAAAVKANIERAQRPESTVASTLASVQSVEAADDTHVVFRLSKPDPSVLWAMAGDGTAGFMISPAAFDTDLAAKPVGSGPFKLVSFQKDVELVFERWDEHWDENAALVQRFTTTFVADGNARFNGVRSGQFDAAQMTAPHDTEANSLEPDGYHVGRALSPSTAGLMLNLNKPPMDDVRVRRAISMAINRPQISEQLRRGVAAPAYQLFHEGYVGYDESLDKDPFNPEEARKLVREAGAEGASLKILQSAGPPHDEHAQVVQEALRNIGLNAELAPISPGESRPTWLKGEYHGLVSTITGRFDPSQTLADSYLGQVNLAPPSTELVQLADKAKVLPFGSDERNRAYQDIGRYLVENPIHIPIVQWTPVTLSRPNVVGSVVTSVGLGEFRGVGLATS